jgi:LmbE family N-acetylglucosaminyl deacetylase
MESIPICVGRTYQQCVTMRSRALQEVRNFLSERAYPTFCEGLEIAGRPLLLSRAEDVTSETALRSCLVLAPHPDDETLGCGATIMQKLAVGTPVHVVIATDGRYWPPNTNLPTDALIEIREDEARRACGILGLPRENIAFLRFEDGRLADNRQLLLDRLADILNETNPEEIFVPSIIDTHPDHRILAELGRKLARTLCDRPPLVYEYPIWFWDPRILRLRQLFNLRIRVVRMEEFRMRKREAIAAYRSQVTNFFGEAGWTARRGFLRQFLRSEEIFFEI